jgi:phosphate transport system permease protein
MGTESSRQERLRSALPPHRWTKVDDPESVAVVASYATVIAGACTLALLVLPVVIMAAREALRTVPDSMREAALGMGSTRWQMVRRVVLPMALPGILTGSILAISRAIGETAPLLLAGAVAFITFAPDGLDSPYTALPMQIYKWTSMPKAESTAPWTIPR